MREAQRSVPRPTFVPGAADGALSRRKLFRTLFQTLAAGVTMAGITSLFGVGAAHAQTKVSQATAKYQDHPNSGNSCAMCNYFRPPNACQLVDGTISPAGWCSFFMKKES